MTRSEVTSINVSGINLDQTTATLTVGGDPMTLTATVAPDNATDKTVTWMTSDASVATVDDSGVVTAVGAGTATITATATNGTDDTSDNCTATCKITVNKLDSKVTKAPEAKTLTYTGQAQELVTAGIASGGTMQYALGNETEATESYTTSIPAKTDAGT